MSYPVAALVKVVFDVLKQVKEPQAVLVSKSEVDANCTQRAKKEKSFIFQQGPHVKYHVKVYQTSYCISVSINEL